MKITKVGIIGAGTMGLGVAQVAAQAGFDTVVVKATPGPTDKAQASIDKTLARAVERGKLQASERDAIRGRIEFSGETYEFRAFTRLKQLKYLQRTHQVDDDLFWSPLGVGGAARPEARH